MVGTGILCYRKPIVYKMALSISINKAIPILFFPQMLPILFKYERTPDGLKKVNSALNVFNIYLQRLKSKYSAGGK